jgi:hypothetical protein
MRCRLSDTLFSGLALGLAVLASACQSGGGDGLEGAAAPDKPKITESELRAFCPPVGLREGTAFFTTYETPKAVKRTKAQAVADATADSVSEASDFSDKPTQAIVFQTSITDVTRSCTRQGGTLSMKIGVAGKVVPGRAAKAGPLALPIRIAVLSGDQVIFSQLFRYSVQVSDLQSATQFLFTADDVSFPDPNTRAARAYAGFDEGPPKQAAQ